MQSYFLATITVTSRGTMSSLDDVKCGWEQGSNEAAVIIAQQEDGEVTVCKNDGDESVTLGFADDTLYVCGKHIKDVIRVLWEDVSNR